MRLTHWSRGALGFVVAAGLCLLAVAPVGAQTTSATVSGSIVDAQGGVLPGATVELTSRTQGNTLTANTDAQGRFVFPVVRPDSYTMRITMQGFKTAERTNVVVSPNDRFSAGTITLEVGQMTEEVSVVSRVSELQAESGERSFTLESEALENIANNGRAMFNFATLIPGVLQNGNVGDEIGAADGFTVNGQRQNSNNVTMDGVANIDTGNNGGNMATTNIDAVAEFKILTNAYQAEYGRAVGGQVQVVTKSGTQSFHGSAYWYGRRSGWDANTWLNKRGSTVIEPPDSKRDDYGYTIGGPIFIPGTFNEDKSKLFFFWSQEFQRRSNPPSQRLSRVPTALERMGDFSQSIDSSGNPWPYIRDYTTGLPCGPGDQSGCYADGGVLGRIPQSAIWQPGLNALNMYPTPNFDGGGGINYQSQASDSAPRREDLIRLDFQATDNWRLTGRYMHTKENITQAYGTQWAGNGSNNLPMEVLFLHPGYNWMVSATGILSPTMSLEMSVGSAHNSLDYQLQEPNLFRSAAGLDGFPLLFPDALQADYLPDLRFNGGRVGGSAGYYQTDRGPFTNLNTTYDVLANLTKVWHRHTAKAGVYYQSSYKPQSIFASFNSQINFNDNTSNPFDTGFGYANAATGVFNTYTQASKFALPEWKYKNFEFYVQDNWKVDRRLTLDYGVRFYYLTPQWDVSLQASNFLPDKFDPANAATLYVPGCLNAYPCSGSDKVAIDPTTGQTADSRFIGRLVPGSDRFNGAFQAGQGINDELQDGNVFKVSPRFGFAYDLTGEGETIVRGGFGIFYDRPQGNIVFDMIANAPGVLVSRLEWGRLQDLQSAGGDPDPVLNMNPTAYNFIPPKVIAWNVGIQKKLFRKLIFDLAYVGSKSEDLLRQNQINTLPRGTTFKPENQDPTRAPSSTPGASALPTDLLRPYQGYGSIRLWEYTGFSNYHALQTGLSRRFENGIMFSAFYVWSKALGIGNDDFTGGLASNVSEAEARRIDYSYLGYDRPHNFVLNFVYQTPKFAESGLGAILLNDWTVSGVYRWTSGRPYTVGYSIPGYGNANLTGNDGNPSARIVVTCDPGSGSSGDPYRQIDTSCFAPPQPGSDGSESARYFVHGPGVNNLDLSVAKAFTFGKGLRLEVRLDAFNALNHTQFTGVNATANFAGVNDPTITNLPYDSAGNLVNQNGFGTINGVARPRTLQLVTRFTF